MNHRRRSAIIGSIISIFILSLATWTLLNLQYVHDLYSFWQYKPSPAIESIASRAGLSEQGKFYLYTSQATVEDADSFNNYCQKREEKSAILGCYTNNRIYIYDVENKQLDGIKEVTAAHEMLHAAWIRTDEQERSRITILLEQAYAQNVTPELIDRMDYYSRNQPGQRANELHSIIATEVTDLNPELEKYYSKYFSDRGKVASLHKKYIKVFDELKIQSETLYKQIVALESLVKKLKASYESEVFTLNADIEAFNAKARNNGFESAQEFEAERDALSLRIDEVKAKEKQLLAQISLYNKKVREYQALAVQSEALNKSIDSTVEPVPSF